MKPDGNLLAAGSFARTADFDPVRGRHTLTSAGDTDGYLAELTRDGKLVQVDQFGGAGADSARAVASHGTMTLLAGDFTGRVKFARVGGVVLTSVGNKDGFLAKFWA